jgi:ElaB/YqjD/DUF883 family membrane-anchored ribosome-binding protein
MGPTADQLRQEIDQKREDAASKIDELETRVQETALGVKSEVEETAQKVKQSFDLKHQVEQNPLLAVGAGLLGGFLLGGLTGGGGGGGSRYSSGGKNSGLMGTLRNAAREAGLEDTISTATTTLMGTFSERIKGAVDQQVPGLVDKIGGAASSGGQRTQALGSGSTSPQVTTDRTVIRTVQ